MKYILLSIAALVFAIDLEGAEGVQWRNDYSKAVQEAAATKKPLLLDFGNQGCVYCRKLDATTFRDPAMIRLLNEQFVTIKIDGDRDPKLVQAMRVESYPTLVVASPDGAVLSINPGYLDATGMMRFLQAAVGKLPKVQERVSSSTTNDKDGPVSLLQQANRDFQDGFYLCCVERCERLMKLHPMSAERDQARQLAERATNSGGDESRALLTLIRQPR